MDADVAVIGVGTIGSMALWRLAERGVNAIGFERYAPGHDRGAAGGNTRLFRVAYMEGSQYVPLLQRSETLWHELNSLTGTEILEQCGGLNIGKSDHVSMQRVEESIEEYGLQAEHLSRHDTLDRFPQFNLDDDEYSIFDPKAGVIRSDQAVINAANQATQKGAEIYSYHEVTRISENNESVEIVANGDIWTVKRVIVASGAWTPAFMPEQISHFVQPRRVLQSWFSPKQVSRFTPDAFPMFARNDGTNFVYGVPAIDRSNVKVSGIPSTDISDPDNFTRRHTPTERVEMMNLTQGLVNGLYPDPVRSATFTELYSRDGHGLIGWKSRDSNILLASAFSGRGFKMAPAIGEALSRIMIGESVPEAAFMNLERIS